MAAIIYHLTTQADYETYSADGVYSPPSLRSEGFIHGSGSPEVTLAVAHSYFSKVAGEIWVLELAVNALQADIRWEAPAPPGGVAQPHHKEGLRFPHIYGEIKATAIVGRGTLGRSGGGFTWPESFTLLSG